MRTKAEIASAPVRLGGMQSAPDMRPIACQFAPLMKPEMYMEQIVKSVDSRALRQALKRVLPFGIVDWARDGIADAASMASHVNATAKLFIIASHAASHGSMSCLPLDR